MFRMELIAVVATLLIDSLYCRAWAQDSHLRPSLDVVVAPIVTDHPKVFTITGGGVQNLQMTLKGQPGESWGSAALVLDYNSPRRLGMNCDGYTSDPPNMRFHYVAAALPDIRVLATSDTVPFTLVVRAPNGHFYCSFAKGLLINGALIMFIAPPAGQYDIWVAFMHSGETHKAAVTLLTMARKNQGSRR